MATVKAVRFEVDEDDVGRLVKAVDLAIASVKRMANKDGQPDVVRVALVAEMQKLGTLRSFIASRTPELK